MANEHDWAAASWWRRYFGHERDGDFGAELSAQLYANSNRFAGGLITGRLDPHIAYTVVHMGTAGADTLAGTSDSQYLNGRGGNDRPTRRAQPELPGGRARHDTNAGRG